MKLLQTHELLTKDPKYAAEIIRGLLKKTKVVKITPNFYLGDLRNFYDTLVENIGTPMNIGEDFKNNGSKTGERWLEIKYDHDVPDLSAYRYSKNAQPLHTDESYVNDPADIMLFYSVNKARKGGATTFIDGQVLLKYMESHSPELLNKLKNTKVRYKKAEEERTEQIMRIDDNGQVYFNFNYYCIDPEESGDNKTINTEFFDFLQTHVAKSDMIEKVTLSPGEAVLWWDELVLHGRTSFEAEKTEDRFIWKTGFKWKS